MQKIPLNLAEPGMILAKPIISDKGIQLCGEGTELTAPLIARLNKMQISFVTLKGKPVESGAIVPSTAACVQELNVRFSKIRNDPVMDKIKAAVLHALIARSQEDAKRASREKRV
jgi:hypothetical protein